MNVASRRHWRLGCVSVLVWSCLVFGIVRAQYDPSLQYGPRGDRREGIRTIPVSGYDIELLSSRIAPPGGQRGGEGSAWADTLRLRFYLPIDDRVFVTVRQLRSQSTYYWLDQVNTRWTPRSVNEYGWPTTPVLRQLPRVRLEDLGVIVRLGHEGPAKREKVLPAVLFEAGPVDRAEIYRFSLKTNGRANVTAAIYRGDEEVYRRPPNWEPAASPFTIVWSVGAASEGWYRLVLSGYFEDNTPLDKEVAFYHRPQLGGATSGGVRQ